MVKIDSTSFGEIVIDKKTYYSDITVWWDGKIEYRDKSHVFDMSEFVRIMERKPDTIVIGIGQTGILKLLPEVKQVAEDKKVKIFVEQSPKAIEIFNGFVCSGKKVVAVIHTTC